MRTVPPVVPQPELVTPGWLTDVLRHAGAVAGPTRVVAFKATPIGTGQVGANVRFALTYEGEPGPASVVCKFASADPDSAAAGIASHTYDTEVAFYRELAGTVGVDRPHCYFADGEAGTANVVLVLEDLHPAEQGDQLDGCTVAQAEQAMDEVARLHGPRWGDPGLEDLRWLNRDRSSGLWEALPSLWLGFVDRYRPALAALTVEEGDRMLASIAGLADRVPAARTAVHGDFRLDNLLFHPASETRPLTVVDWQTVRLGAGPEDVAYFLGSSFPDPAVRRAHEARLVRRYHEALLGLGVQGYSFERCWEEYRRSAYGCLLMAVIAGMAVGRTERGDRMFVAMADRSAQMAVDLDAAAALAAGV